MTMKKIKLSNIVIGSRIRKNMGDTKELAANIVEHGLIHPITVTPNNTLIDGHRRLLALQLNKEEFTDVHVMSMVAEDGIIKVEFDANEQRKEFTKSEKAQAMVAFKEDNISHGGKHNPSGKNKKGSSAAFSALDQTEKDKKSRANQNEAARAVGFTGRDEAQNVARVARDCNQKVIDLMDSETISAHTLVRSYKIQDLTDDEQSHFVNTVEKYGKSKAYYHEYHPEVIRALEAKEINRDKADGITEAVKRKPERTVTWIKANIKNHTSAAEKSASKAEGAKKHEEYKEQKKYEDWTDIKISKDNLAESIRNILNVIGYDNVASFRKAITKEVMLKSRDESQ